MQAEDGIGLPEEILEQSNFQSAAKLYFFFTRLDFLWTLNYFALIILNFIEVCIVLQPVVMLCCSTLIGADLHPVLPGLHPGHV